MYGLEKRIEELVAAQLERPITVTQQKRFVEDLGFDSLKMFDFMMVLEDELDVLIPVGATYNIKTVGDLCRAVAQLVSADLAECQA